MITWNAGQCRSGSIALRQTPMMLPWSTKLNWLSHRFLRAAAMSKTRNNHYVPRWYQEGFFEIDRNTLAYLDMRPPQKVLDGGRVITGRVLFDTPTSRAFRQLDLYSTFFGTSVNDEIERRLFGDIDGRGSNAVRAFIGTDVSEWHQHFQIFFEFLDIQKIRTPKGLDWLKAQYPTLI